VAIGNLEDAQRNRTIDAHGMVVARHAGPVGTYHPC
jgi:hypothetical protein